MDTLAEWVDCVERGPRSHTSLTSNTSAEIPASESQLHLAPEGPLTWADRDPSERMAFDPDEVLLWPEEDPELTEDQGCQLHRVSTATESLLRESFAKTVPNGTRRQWRQVYGMQVCDATKYLRLDATIKAQVLKACKDGDRPLARLQTLLLDAVGPLTSLVEQWQKGHLTPKAAAEAVTQALRFLGNASAAISQERRRHVADCLNKDLRPLLEEDDRFKEAPPFLFGKEFERSAKDHIDSMKSLRRIAQ